jgi:hypothetical protein
MEMGVTLRSDCDSLKSARVTQKVLKKDLRFLYGTRE